MTDAFVIMKSIRLDIAKYSFSNRVANEWDNLSEEVHIVKVWTVLRKLDNRRYTLCLEKVYPYMFDNNFDKCELIFKTLQ